MIILIYYYCLIFISLFLLFYLPINLNSNIYFILFYFPSSNYLFYFISHLFLFLPIIYYFLIFSACFWSVVTYKKVAHAGTNLCAVNLLVLLVVSLNNKS